MKLLLDTHVLLWARNAPARLSRTAQAAITDPRNERWVSLATLWEIQIKHKLGKLTLGADIDRLADNWLRDLVATRLDIKLNHVGTLYQLPLHHRDPFDRMLVAQAIAEDLAIISSDPQLSSYSATVIW